MKIGICSSEPKQFKHIAECGYDYIEMTFSVIANATDEQFAEIKKSVLSCGLRVEATNGHFPGNFKLYSYDETTGEARDFSEIEANVREYNERGYSRAQELGVRVSVVGSGTARRIPDGLKREVAEEQFARVLEICGEVAAKYGAEIVIEPLNHNETNFINTLEEGLEMCKRVNSPHVFVLNDFYHSHVENEPVEMLAKAGKLLNHAHIANFDRVCPTLEADGDDLLPLVKALKAIDYNGRISLECKYLPDFKTAIENAVSFANEVKKI